MKLSVKDKKIVDDKGNLFFYTADTAWELFHKLTLEEARMFIDNRASKGFNVIQAVAVAELDGLKKPAKANDELPYQDEALTVINDRYFEHVKEVISYANSKGIFIALVPMWGSYFVANAEWGGKVKPVFDGEKAYSLVSYLANKLKGMDVIWILGGDRPYFTEESINVMNSMARAVRETSGAEQLITAHTQGGRSVYDMLDAASWLDFVTWQSGHMGSCYPSWRSISEDYNRLSIPVLDAEPCYESHPIMNEYSFTRSDCASRFTDYHVRRSSYWSVFSGGCGITYGCYGIWQMRQEADENQDIPESAASAYKNDSIPYWHQSLNYPGSFQIGYLRRFIETLPDNTELYPDNSLIISDNPKGAGHMAAITNRKHSVIAVYVPSHSHLCVDISVFKGQNFSINWFDPRYNIWNYLSDSSSETRFVNITSPMHGDDYVLVLKKIS